jgi:roadblock/LC7 domain-containing protein
MKSLTKIQLLAVTLSVVFGAGEVAAAAAPNFKEQRLGAPSPLDVRKEGLFSTESEQGCHIGWVTKVPHGLRVVVDGKAGSPYDDDDPFSRVFSSDGRHLAYSAKKGEKWCVVLDDRPGPLYDDVAGGSMSFSPDGKRLAYVAQKQGKWCAVIDGSEAKSYDQVGDARAAMGSHGVRGDGRLVRFSPDGKHAAYAARTGDKWCIVVDGREGRFHDEIATQHAASEDYDAQLSGWHMCLSAKGDRVAYTAKLGTNWVVVVDGKVSTEYREIAAGSLSFSPTGTHAAYTARKGDEWCAVVDGHEGNLYEGAVGAVTFSPDGSRMAYAAKKGQKWCVVVDGREEGLYDKEIYPEFSPDGKHVKYVAVRGDSGDKEFIVLDGKEGTAYGSLEQSIFSPDSKHVAYSAQRGDETSFLVVDGKQQKLEGKAVFLFFSPNSQHLAYYLEIRGTWCVVVDGKPNATYPGTVMEDKSLHFSPDSRHVTYALIGMVDPLERRYRALVVVDGQESPTYHGIDAGPVFRSDGTLEFIGSRDEVRYRVTASFKPTQ